MEDSRFIERIVLFNESVIYTNDNIRITDSDGIETARFDIIFKDMWGCTTVMNCILAYSRMCVRSLIIYT